MYVIKKPRVVGIKNFVKYTYGVTSRVDDVLACR